MKRSIRSTYRLGGLITLIGVLVSWHHAAGAQQLPITLERITEQWKKREATFPAFAATWKVRHMYAKGSLLNLKMSKEDNPKSLVAPASDYTFVSNHSIKVDGVLTRLEYTWHSWSTPDSQFREINMIEVFDGKTNTMFDSRVEDFSRGTLRHEPFSRVYANMQTRPLIMALRPSRLPARDFDFDRLVLATGSALFSETNCRILENKGSSWKYWVDPGRDFLILRCLSQSKTGRIQSSLDIEWSFSEGTWLPKQWLLSSFDMNGLLTRSSFAYEVEYDMSYQGESNEFGIAFPPRTLVTDAKNYPKSKTSHFVIDTEGSKRQVTAEELSSTASEDLLKPRIPLWKYSVVIVVSALFVTMCLVLAYRIRSHTRKGELP